MRVSQWIGVLVFVVTLTGLALLPMPSALAAQDGDEGGWVTLTLRDGREFVGEILEETSEKITIEYRIGSITSRQTFAAYDVAKIERHAPPAGTVPNNNAPAKPQKRKGGYVLVPTKGVFGKDITANLFRKAIEDAIKRDAEAVIFELESNGGYLFGLHQIYDVIKEHRDEIKIVFYTNGNCFSAAALVCLATDHFYAGPGTSFGAAVVIRGNDKGGHDAVEQKFAAAEAAIWRKRVNEAKHPSILVDPLMILEAELWADMSTTPWTLYKSEPKDLPEGAQVQRIDSDKTILGATQEQLLDLGAIDGTAKTFRDVLQQLDLDQPGIEAVDGKKIAGAVKRIQKNNIKDIDNRVRAIRAAVIALGNQQNAAGFRRQLRSIKGSIDRIRRMMGELDYIEFHCRVERGITNEELDSWDAAVTAAINATRNR